MQQKNWLRIMFFFICLMSIWTTWIKSSVRSWTDMVPRICFRALHKKKKNLFRPKSTPLNTGKPSSTYSHPHNPSSAKECDSILLPKQLNVKSIMHSEEIRQTKQRPAQVRDKDTRLWTSCEVRHLKNMGQYKKMT